MNSENQQKKDNFFTEILKFALIVIIIIVPVRMYVAEPFIVYGGSMNPTFANGQYLMVDQLTYRFEDPQRGDVIIFRYPKEPKTYYIKRIIALPGETLTMDNGRVRITNSANPNGILIDEKYLAEENRTSDTFEITLGPTEYFVMGDNRPQSSDSRLWGPLEKKYIVGRPFLRLFPFSVISVFPGR